MKLILEINGKVKEHILIPEQGITIGRSWDNDVILKDRYVDPKQVKLSLVDDQLIIEDLNSTNGTEVSGQQVNGKSLTYKVGDLISVGDTIIRLLKVTTDVAQTRRRSLWFHFVRFFKPIPLLALLLIAVGGLYVFSGWIFSTTPYSLANAASGFFESVSAIFMIAGLFAVLVNQANNAQVNAGDLLFGSFVLMFNKTLLVNC